MATFEGASRRRKTFRVKHAESGEFCMDYILLPMGYAYNAEFRSAKKGDILKLWNGGSYPIFSVQILSLRKPIADLLCRIRYGITIKRAIQKWKMNAQLEGHGKSAVSEDECLWIVFDKNEMPDG